MNRSTSVGRAFRELELYLVERQRAEVARRSSNDELTALQMKFLEEIKGSDPQLSGGSLSDETLLYAYRHKLVRKLGVREATRACNAASRHLNALLLKACKIDTKLHQAYGTTTVLDAAARAGLSSDVWWRTSADCEALLQQLPGIRTHAPTPD